MALVGTKNLVAVSALADDDRYSHISEEVKDLKKVTFNAEVIYALNPSLVLASNFSSAKTKFALKRIPIHHVYLNLCILLDQIPLLINCQYTRPD